MRKSCIISALGLMISLGSGCDGGGLTPNQKAAANKQWNEARANVLASLANDQYKEGVLDKCQDTLRQALRLTPENPKLHLLQAKLSLELNQLEVAQAQLFEVQKLDPAEPEADYLNGVIQQRWHQLEKAESDYAAASRKNPAEVSYVLAQAETLVAMERPEDALSLLETKATFFEHSAALKDEIGQLMVLRKRLPEGINALREACMLAADDLTIREHLAFALLAAKQYAEAISSFNELLKDPACQKRADLHASLAEAQNQEHLLPDARHEYEMATQLNPSGGGYWLALAKVSSESGDLPGAEIAVRRAISIDPLNGSAQCLLGFVRMKQNQLPQSLAAFKAAADLDPHDSVSICLEGYVLSLMGKSSEAQRFYERALEIDPNNGLAGRLAGNKGAPKVPVADIH